MSMTAVMMYLFIGALCGYVWGRLTAPTREDVYSAAEQIYEAGYDDGINDRRR